MIMPAISRMPRYEISNLIKSVDYPFEVGASNSKRAAKGQDANIIRRCVPGHDVPWRRIESLERGMYPVAHMGAAVAAVKAGDRFLPAGDRPPDYRFAALGALVPDLIDKPLERLGIAGVPDGHTFAHTLLFSTLLIVTGTAVARRKKDTRLLLVGLGSLTHLLVDPVIVYPRTLFWPVFGLDFGRSNGIPSPYLVMFDLALIAAFGIAAARSPGLRERVLAFVRTGSV
jgi:hypothetical protein